MLWTKSGNLEEAIANYGEVIRLEHRLTPAYSSRGFVWSAKHNFKKALTEYDEAIRIDLRFVLAYLYRIRVHHEEGHFDKAIANYSGTIRLQPGTARGRTNLTPSSRTGRKR